MGWWQNLQPSERGAAREVTLATHPVHVPELRDLKYSERKRSFYGRRRGRFFSWLAGACEVWLW